MIKFLAILCWVFLLSATAYAQESMTTNIDTFFLNKLIDTAKVHYPKAKTFDHQILLAQNNLKRVKLSWFDALNVSGFYSPSNARTLANATLSGYQFGLNLNVSSLIQKPSNIKQAKEEVIIAKLNKEDYNGFIAALVKAHYYKFVQQKLELAIQNQLLIEVESIMKQVKYKFEKGEDSYENYSKALIAVSQQKQTWLNIEADMFVAKNNLEEIIGMKLEAIH